MGGSAKSRAAAGLALLILAAGCGPSHSGAQVSGKVTYKGEPVTGGTMKIYRESASGGPGADSAVPVTIKPDGTFVATNVPLGTATVTIETETIRRAGGGPAVNPTTGLPAGAPMPPGYDPSKFKPAAAPSPEGKAVYVKIPEKYGDPKTSNLSWDIKAGSNPRDFELTD